MGLGKIEPLMRDSQIEDISCDGIGIPIFVFHRNPELGSVSTNIIFYDGDELDSFITRLGQLTGKSISVAEPLLDGALPDGSRLQATLATDIARKGSNFTIRKFSEDPITPIHLLKYGSVSVQTLAYLWMAVDYGRSILVSGGTASGKTSFLNAISLFIRPDKKIISIEDTAELRLPHPHWVPTVARTSVSTKENSNEIDMFALLKESLRQRPDYIIVGEVRGQEAFVLFQQMATGHPSYATIHAENMEKLVDRLTTAPISLPKTLVGSLDLVIFLLRVRYRDRFVRRTNEVVEMVDFPQSSDNPVVNTVFKWDSMNDRTVAASKSVLLKKITESTGMTEQEVVDEMKRRMMVLNWMSERNITEYRDVYKMVNMYYFYPNRVLATIMGGE
jgi:flagellar protein FlaI